MYGGDEVSAIVLDVGSYNTRAGYAGEETPKCIFPSIVGVTHSSGKDNTVGKGAKSVGENEVEMTEATESNNNSGGSKHKYYPGNDASFRRDFMDIHNPFDKGLISNWEEVEQLWDHAFFTRLRINPKEHPILMAEPSFNTRLIREKMTEIMFEKYDTPAFFLAKSGVLSSFACGKSSSVVLDTGGGVTTITPVHEGYALQKATIRSSLAGELLTDEYLKAIERKSVTIRPHYTIQSKKEISIGQFEVVLKELPNTTKSYHAYQVNQVVRDVKESCCRVSEVAFDDDSNTTIPSIPYELPDGHTLDVGTERFKVPELMFNPDPLNKRGGFDEEFTGIHTMIANCIAKCEPDIRRELWSSIIVSGGNSLFPQFPERLFKELNERAVPQAYKVKIISTNSTIERKFASWIGGSILASLGTFHQLWMSKQEYEEHGKSLVERKCP
eukprot:CAMPEP_0168544418 /NCGR_PEP_ID=MMETSP0413-20121227/2410_1 /TAXON_ID=136452 /ORGANISM="Filamoeba nolandi, Strain NC-AS-23-1" /LENGTH=441 /DNA_ID=CAMNT_0008574439 /DNA_START=21 /DNA_END=1346 /DNA_ORIENTATION=+